MSTERIDETSAFRISRGATSLHTQQTVREMGGVYSSSERGISGDF